MASKVALEFNPKKTSSGFVWENETHAKKALKAINIALKTGRDKQVPEWATKAISEGWKPPRGWKP